MQRENPYDQYNGKELFHAIESLKGKPLARESATLSAQARGHLPRFQIY